MTAAIFWTALTMSVLSWMFFIFHWVFYRFFLTKANIHKPEVVGIAKAQLQADVDPTKIIDATGNVATSFRKAGVASTAAALSVFFLLIALVAAGIAKIPTH